MDFGSFSFSHCPPDLVERNVCCGMSQHPSTTTGRFRGDQPEASQLGQHTPNHYSIRANAGGDKPRSQALFRC